MKLDDQIECDERESEFFVRRIFTTKEKEGHSFE